MKEKTQNANAILSEQAKTQQSTHLTLESKKYSLRSRDSKLGNIKDKKLQHKKLRCHYCRTRDIGKKYTICGSYPNCRCGFCSDCLKNVFELNAELLTKGWVCVVCHGFCNCQRCKTKFLVKINTTPRSGMENNMMDVNSILNIGNRKNNIEEEECELRESEMSINKDKGTERSVMKRPLHSLNEPPTKKKIVEEDKEFNNLPMNPSIIYPIKYPFPNIDPIFIPPYTPMIPKIPPMAPYFVVDAGNQLYQSYLNPSYCTILQNPISIEGVKQGEVRSKEGSGQGNIGYTMKMPQVNEGPIIEQMESFKESPNQNAQEKNEIGLQKGNNQ